MVIDLISFGDRHDRKRLESWLRERQEATNFADALYCNYNYLSNDFIREFKKEFAKRSTNMTYDDKWHFKYNRDLDFFDEIFGKENR